MIICTIYIYSVKYAAVQYFDPQALINLSSSSSSSSMAMSHCRLLVKERPLTSMCCRVTQEVDGIDECIPAVERNTLQPLNTLVEVADWPATVITHRGSRSRQGQALYLLQYLTTCRMYSEISNLCHSAI